MKFRHLEKVRVRSGYYRNYCGIVVGFTKVLDAPEPTTVSPIEVIVYQVKLTITKDPFKEETKEFKESELAARLF